MPLLKRLRVMAAKVEGTIGTDSTPTGTDGAFNAYDVMIQPSIAMTDRESNCPLEMIAHAHPCRALQSR